MGFFEQNINKSIVFKRSADLEARKLSVPELLIENMDCCFANETKDFFYDHFTLREFLKSHFQILNWALLHTDLTLPSLVNPTKSIASVVFDFLKSDSGISSLIRNELPDEVSTDDVKPEILKMYMQKYKLEVKPETILFDLVILLSDDAFERLRLAATSGTKSPEYLKKLVGWILPEITLNATKPSLMACLLQTARICLSIFFEKIFLLITLMRRIISHWI